MTERWTLLGTCADNGGNTGLPSLLRQPGVPTPETASGWRDRIAVDSIRSLKSGFGRFSWPDVEHRWEILGGHRYCRGGAW